MEEKETNIEIETEGTSTKGEQELLVESLTAENEQLKKEVGEYKDNWLRSRADFENFRKRNNETRRTAYEDGKIDAVKKILQIGDNLDRAVLTVADEQIKKGLEMTVIQFNETLKNLGVEPIEIKEGDKFDPNFAEAVMAVDAVDGEVSGNIKQVFLKGYKLGDKVIRYAQVVVVK